MDDAQRKCLFIDDLLNHPQGEQLFAAWRRMRAMEPAFNAYLYGGETLMEMTRRIVEERIAATKNVTEAARMLGISRATIYRLRAGRDLRTPRKVRHDG